MPNRASSLRFPLIGLVGFLLLAALWAALERIGWKLPVLRPGLAVVHGPLMISGVLGALISLERVVALSALPGLNFRWSYLAPTLSGLGSLVLVITGEVVLAKALITVGSLFLVYVFIVIVRQHFALFSVVMALGSVSWFVGNLLWLAEHPVFQVVHTWAAFLVLTIVGERLELSRVTRLSTTSQQLFALATLVFVGGVCVTLLNLDFGVRLAGVGELALAVWLLRYDIARHTVRREGLPQFIAVCLLAGYVWLGIGGTLGIVFGAVYAGLPYDALLHTLFLGFAFSMIFGHAPIIFPSLTGREITFQRFFYGYLALLHLSLVLREAGDLTGWLLGRKWGGLLNVAAILLFLASTAYTLLNPPPKSGGLSEVSR